MTALTQALKAEKTLATTLSAIVIDSGYDGLPFPTPESVTLVLAIGSDALTGMENAYGKLNITEQNPGDWFACFGDYDEGVRYGSGRSRREAFDNLLECYQ